MVLHSPLQALVSWGLTAVALLAGGNLSRAAAQSTATTVCNMTGGVRNHDIPLPGVAVTFAAANRVVASTSTDDEGAWQVRVPAGRYTVVFDLRGFAAGSRDQVVEEGNCPARIDTQLEVTRPGNLGDSSTTRFSNRLPRTSSAPATTITLQGRAASVNRAALRERAAALARGEFTLGADSWSLGLVAVVPSTANEVAAPLVTRALTIAPGLGAAVAAAQNTLRAAVIPAQRLYSATASYTVAGSALDRAPYQLRPDAPHTKPSYFRHSVDFTIGGPLAPAGVPSFLRRTNATVSYSAIRGGNLFDRYSTVPTDAMRAGDFSSLATPVRDPQTGLPFPNNRLPAERFSPAALNLLALIPHPNSAGTARNFHLMSTNRSTEDRLNVRLTQPIAGSTPPTRPAARGGTPAVAFVATLNGQIDYRRNINDRLSAISSISGVGETSTLRVPVSLNVTRRGTQHSVAIGYVRSTNNTTNRYAGVQNIADGAGIQGASADPFAWGIPTLSFGTLTSVSDLTPSERLERRLTIGYGWSRGFRAHRLRLGGEAGSTRLSSRTDQNARGAFIFTGLYSGSDFGDFLLGQPQQASVQFGPGVVHLAGRALSLYAQDDWRRWTSVTLNAGLRYELVTPFSERAGQLANLDVAPGFTSVSPVAPGSIGPYSGRFPSALVATDWNNLAPRIGAAWRIAPRTTLRAGYGVSFSTGSYSSLARQLAGQPPFAITNTAIGTSSQPLSLTSALTAGAPATTNSFAVARDYEAGTVGTSTLGLGRDMGDAWNLSAGLTHARGSHLDIVRAPNRGPDGLRLAGVQPFLWQTSEGQSRLRSASVWLRRWYVRGWSLSVDYTLARSLDNASTIGGGSTVVAQDEQNLAAEWGPSSFSRRHQMSGDLNFELPFGEGHRWLNRGGPWAALVGSWSAYFTFSAQSGTPLTARVLSNASDVARGTNGTLRAQLTGAPITTHPTADRFFNTAAFAMPTPGTFGDSGRNAIVGPVNRSLDLQMTKDIRAGETRMITMHLRVSNMFNLVNYGSVDTAVNSPTFGQVTSVRSMRSTQINVRWKF